MYPIFQAILARSMIRQVKCPHCKKKQLVTREHKRRGVRCKYCKKMIPASNDR